MKATGEGQTLSSLFNNSDVTELPKGASPPYPLLSYISRDGKVMAFLRERYQLGILRPETACSLSAGPSVNIHLASAVYIAAICIL